MCECGHGTCWESFCWCVSVLQLYHTARHITIDGARAHKDIKATHTAAGLQPPLVTLAFLAYNGLCKPARQCTIQMKPYSQRAL